MPNLVEEQYEQTKRRTNTDALGMPEMQGGVSCELRRKIEKTI